MASVCEGFRCYIRVDDTGKVAVSRTFKSMRAAFKHLTLLGTLDPRALKSLVGTYAGVDYDPGATPDLRVYGIVRSS